MNAVQVLAHARALGIVLSGGGGRLRYEAPRGCLTPELRQALVEHKPAILDLLEAERDGWTLADIFADWNERVGIMVDGGVNTADAERDAWSAVLSKRLH